MSVCDSLRFVTRFATGRIQPGTGARRFGTGGSGTRRVRTCHICGTGSSRAQLVAPAITGTIIGRHTILMARPYDANHAVTAVRFLLDGKNLAEAGAPGRFNWNAPTLRAGRHVVQVQAFSGTTFVGQSEPVAVYIVDTAAARSLEVPFYTYEDTRRAPAIAPPRLAQLYAHGPRLALAQESAERVGHVTIDVFLNGEKQEFAPAARLASADEMSIANSGESKSGVVATFSNVEGERIKNTPGATRTVWIPARPLLEKLGAHMQWQAASRTLVADLRIAGGVRRLMLTAGGDGARANIDGRQLEVQSPVRQTDNALMVPISFCEQALDLRVSWQPQSRRVEMFTAIYPA